MTSGKTVSLSVAIVVVVVLTEVVVVPGLPNMQQGVDLPVAQHAEYSNLFDQMQPFLQEVDSKLSMYLYFLKSEEMVKKLIAIVCWI